MSKKAKGKKESCSSSDDESGRTAEAIKEKMKKRPVNLEEKRDKSSSASGQKKRPASPPASFLGKRDRSNSNPREKRPASPPASFLGRRRDSSDEEDVKPTSRNRDRSNEKGSKRDRSKERGSGKRERSKDVKRDRSEERSSRRERSNERGPTSEAHAEGTNLRRRGGVVKGPKKRDLQGARGHQRRAQGGEGTLPPPLKTVAEGLVVGRRSNWTK